MSVLGAQIPLSTFARTDPDVAGYGLGADAAFVSTLIGRVRRLPGHRRVHAAADLAAARARATRWSLVLAAGRARLRAVAAVPRHAPGRRWSTWRSPASAPARWSPRCPAAAAAAAPPERTGFATGMTNATKTVGGAIASSIFAIALASTGSLDGPGRGPRPAVGLPHGLGGLRGRRAARRRARCWSCPAAPPSSAAVGSRRADTRRSGAPDRGLRVPRERATCPRRAGPEPVDRAGRVTPGPARTRPRPGSQQQATWVDLQIRQAMERGDFDGPARRRQADRGPRRGPRPGLVDQEAGRAREDRRAPASAAAAQGGRRARRPARPAQRARRRYAARSRTSTSA